MAHRYGVRLSGCTDRYSGVCALCVSRCVRRVAPDSGGQVKGDPSRITTAERYRVASLID